MIKNVISVIDGEAGSCGKAKVIGEIATDENIKLGASITNCMPNAGHTFVDENGKKTIFRNIPVSCVNPQTELFMGPGSAIDMETFKEEYERVSMYLGNRKIYVHEMVPIIEERHKEYERVNIKSGSTFKGCGAVTQEKVVRDSKLKFFQGYENAIVCSNDEWLRLLYNHLNNEHEYVLLEGAQGCDLDLNHSNNYPYVTSRNVSTTQLLADSGISAERLLQAIMVIRPFPIRISNVTKSGQVIFTGGYGTGDELTWSHINIASMCGFYPEKHLLDDFESNLSEELVERLISNCNEIYLKQIFGANYKNINPKNVKLVEAVEMERLINKANGISEYKSQIIDLPFIDMESIIDQSEQTTVTKMERRVFDLDINKLKTNCLINTPSSIYLNFLEHLDYSLHNISGDYNEININRYIRRYLEWLEDSTGVEISMLGTSEKNKVRIRRSNMIKDIIKY